MFHHRLNEQSLAKLDPSFVEEILRGMDAVDDRIRFGAGAQEISGRDEKETFQQVRKQFAAKHTI